MNCGNINAPGTTRTCDLGIRRTRIAIGVVSWIMTIIHEPGSEMLVHNMIRNTHALSDPEHIDSNPGKPESCPISAINPRNPES
jgi:hypothetical protein